MSAVPTTPRITLAMMDNYRDQIVRIVCRLSNVDGEQGIATDDSGREVVTILRPYSQVQNDEIYELIAKVEYDGKLRVSDFTPFPGANLTLFKELAEVAAKTPEIYG